VSKSTVKFKSGDRVIALRWPSGGAGVIVKPAPVYPMVRWDDHDEVKRTRVEDIRPETPQDVAARQLAAEIASWRSTRPDTTLATVSYMGGYGSSIPTGVQVFGQVKPEQMRTLVDELEALAAWFEKRPVSP
jgi:hypothetical protein